MSAKPAKTKPVKAAFRYAPEDLAPRDEAQEEAFVEGFIKRNRDAINGSLKEARASLKRGEGRRYRSPEALTADVMSKVRRPVRKP